MTLTIINAVMFGLLFAVWKKGDWLNFLIKASFLALLVANVVVAAKS